MSDGFFEGDEGEFEDSAFLKELDVIEAAASQKPSRPIASDKLPQPPPPPLQLQEESRPRFKPALRKEKEPPSDSFDEPFDIDVEELDRLDAFIADSYAGKAQPVAGPSKARQTTLDGKFLTPTPAAEPQAKRSFSRTKSSEPKEPKTKTWDRTAFSETGFRSTKNKDAKAKEKDKNKGNGNGNGKGKAVARDDEFDEDFDEEVEFEQFPSPHVDSELSFFFFPSNIQV